MVIRLMQPSDLDFAASCTASEGWASETLEEFQGFLAYDPNGCFIAESDGRRIGLCVATSYGESGFLGELIVLKDVRGRGVGRRLVEHVIQYLHSRGAQNVLLDGVPAALSLYERAGFRKICRSLRFAGKIRGRSHAHVRAMQPGDLAAVADLDRQAFGADRSFFLQRRLSLYPELCKVLERDGQILGFVVARRAHGLVSVGPWVVGRGVEHPTDLLESLAGAVGSLDVGLGVLETNVEAVTAICSFGLTEYPEPSWRMVLGPSEYLGASNHSYAIGSAAKG